MFKQFTCIVVSCLLVLQFLTFVAVVSPTLTVSSKAAKLFFKPSVYCSGVNVLSSDPTSCSKFYSCTANRLAIRMSCGAGTYFNPILLICDWPDNVDCEVHHAPGQDKSFVKEVNSERFRPDSAGQLRGPPGIYGKNFEQGIEEPEFRRGILSPSDARLLGVGLHLNLLSLLKGPAGPPGPPGPPGPAASSYYTPSTSSTTPSSSASTTPSSSTSTTPAVPVFMG